MQSCQALVAARVRHVVWLMATQLSFLFLFFIFYFSRILGFWSPCQRKCGAPTCLKGNSKAWNLLEAKVSNCFFIIIYDWKSSRRPSNYRKEVVLVHGWQPTARERWISGVMSMMMRGTHFVSFGCMLN